MTARLHRGRSILVRHMWTCGNCGQAEHDNLGICRNCGTAHMLQDAKPSVPKRPNRTRAARMWLGLVLAGLLITSFGLFQIVGRLPPKMAYMHSHEPETWEVSRKSVYFMRNWMIVCFASLIGSLIGVLGVSIGLEQSVGCENAPQRPVESPPPDTAKPYHSEPVGPG